MKIKRWFCDEFGLKAQQVTGYGPNTVQFAFLKNKLSNIISAQSNRAHWNHKGLAVLASSHIIYAGEERPTSELSNYADPTAKDAPADTGVYVLSLRGIFL